MRLAPINKLNIFMGKVVKDLLKVCKKFVKIASLLLLIH